MTLLTTKTIANNDVYNYSSTWLTLPDATPASFTLVRPTPILLVAVLSYFGNGGTAQYIQVSGGISATNAPGFNANGNDVDGNEMKCSQGGIGFPTGVSPGILGFYCGVRPFVCPAGTWYAHLNYAMQGGSLTTITNNESSIDVFQLPG